LPHRAVLCLLLMGSSLALASAERPQAFADRCAKAQAGRGVVRILHFGDSHLAGEGAGHLFSHAFHARFGDGGPGLGLPWVSPQLEVTARATPGWRKSRKAGGDKRMGLGAGYLGLSATLATGKVFRAFLGKEDGKAFMHGPTFMGNALACAVALAGIAIFERDGYLDKVRRIEQVLREELLGISAPC